LTPDIIVSTPPNAHRLSKLRPERTPAASETDDSSTSDDKRHTTRKKKFHPRHNKEDEHRLIRQSRSIGKNAIPRPQKKEKPVKSLEDAAAKHQLTEPAKTSSKPAIKLTGEERRGIKPEKYDGLACVKTFLVKFNACACYNN